MPSGDLSGQIGHDASVTYAKMYCHGIATLALAEAYAMTHDPLIAGPLRDAVKYTWNAQDARSGGRRYLPGHPGDLSQFGCKPWPCAAPSAQELLSSLKIAVAC